MTLVKPQPSTAAAPSRKGLFRTLAVATLAAALLGGAPTIAPAEASPTGSTTNSGTKACSTHDFTDVPKTSSFYTAVTWMRCEGISMGYSNGSFGEKRPITRGETAQLLYRLSGETHRPGTRRDFTDVAPGSTAFTAVSWMEAKNYTRGYSDGSFGVNKPITRGELATFLYRMAGESGYRPPSTSPFKDLPTSNAHYLPSVWLHATGLVSGYADSTFRPARDVTRGEAAKFLYAMESRTNGTPPTYQVPVRPAGPEVNATNGRGGTYRDAKSLSYSNGPSTSQYHLYAAHLNGQKPHGIIVHLHGDGAGEYNRPEHTSVRQYLELARKHNLMLVVPRTPDRVGSITWWEGDASGKYAADLFSHLGTRYNLDLNRVYWTGYSGGAETITYKLMDAHSARWTGGAAVIVGGGGANSWRQPAHPISASLKSKFQMHWIVGARDTPSAGGASGSFDAVRAARNGQAHYQKHGMKTSLNVVPGLDHFNITSHGPAKLAQILEGR